MNDPTWYRVHDGRYAPALDEWGESVRGGRSYVSTVPFRVLRETPKGVWLEDGGAFGGKRFVLRDARKRFACPTQEEALESFRARKQRQLKILQAQVRHVETVLRMAED